MQSHHARIEHEDAFHLAFVELQLIKPSDNPGKVSLVLQASLRLQYDLHMVVNQALRMHVGHYVISK